MKVRELEGARLDYWVAKAEGRPLSCDWDQGEYILVGRGCGDMEEYNPSADWSDGGPIIDREQISTWKYDDAYGDDFPTNLWFAAIGGVHGWDDGSIVSNAEITGETPLIAAMRAYVASKFGDDVFDGSAGQ